jgi:hypothetical protein
MVLAFIMGCQSSPVSTTSTPSPPPAAAATSSAATATPSPRPAPSPTGLVVPGYVPPPPPQAVPGVPFEIGWEPIDAGRLPLADGSDGLEFEHPLSLRWGDAVFVAYDVGEDYGSVRGPMLWRSDDLRTWRRLLDPAEEGRWIRVDRLAVGGPGIVAFGEENGVGPVLWVSADGEGWTTITDLPAIRAIWARPGVIVGFGAETWLSTDGLRWNRAGSSPAAVAAAEFLGRVVAVNDGDSALVFVHDYEVSLTRVYRLSPDGSWDDLSELAGNVSHAVRGPDAFVALGYDEENARMGAWRSTDGITWAAAPGPDAVGSLLVTPAGYVAMGQKVYMGGCDGRALEEQIPETWTSHDGLHWRQMPEDLRLDHADLPLLFLEGDHVVSMGIRWSRDPAGEPIANSVAFQAGLPTAQPRNTPIPFGAGCGEE